MDHFVIWVKQHSEWLYVQIYENHFFFIDFWSLAHLWSGFVLFTILLANKYRHPWLWLVIFLSIYEIFEIAMLYISLHIFLPETIKDQFTDVVAGVLGGLLSFLFVSQKAKGHIAFFDKIDIEALFVAETISFLWIDRAQFFFFQPESDPLSVYNYLWRILLGYLILRIYASYIRIDRKVLNGLQVFMISYFSLFIFSGYLSGNYKFSGIFERNLTGENALFNSSYFLYQLQYPFIAILSYKGLHYIFEKASHEIAIKEKLAGMTRKSDWWSYLRDSQKLFNNVKSR
jgi:hypothetical protein